mgnify:CR=1 FL=1
MFFFQAEDGIRDLVRSRGLGDVYKRQEEKRAYRFAEYIGDVLLIARPHPYFAVVADSNSAVSITKYLANEVGYLLSLIHI